MVQNWKLKKVGETWLISGCTWRVGRVEQPAFKISKGKQQAQSGPLGSQHQSFSFPHLHSSLLCKASCHLKREGHDSLEHGSVQLSKQSHSRPQGPDIKPAASSFTPLLSRGEDSPDRTSITTKRKDGAGNNTTKASVNMSLPLTLQTT